MSTTLQKIIDQRLAKLPPATDAFRVADGAPWPGVFIDALADRLLVSLRDTALPPALKDMLKATGRPVYVKRLDKDVKEPPQFLCGPAVPLRFVIQENGVRYLMDMGAGYSQGIFLDQRDNRAELRSLCRPGMKVLNTFAYT
ncbi:MAG: class I SAM-dependent methyltransferase, partial [Akkermansia sp.]|nr:class I SAM-dependent methyltransferase [Akkermansia sp.]